MANTPFPITGIKNPEQIRVLLWANNEYAHVSLSELFKAANTRIATLEARITQLEKDKK